MSTLEHDLIDVPDEAPLELAAPVPVTLRSVPDDDELLAPLPPPAASRPDHSLRRLALIAVAGVVLIGLAGIAREALDRAAPLPPGLMEPMSREGRGGEAKRDTSIARYEFARARALR